MKISLHRPKDNSWNLFRKAGYSQHPDRRHGVSYFRSLQGGLYPRFHIYVEVEVPGEKLIFTIHLDQKKPSYEGSRTHSGEYEGEVVSREAGRLQQLVSQS